MTAWLSPAAFIGLALVAGPVIVHLLRRQRSRRVPFPSLRFVRPSSAAAVRLYTPADWPLLAVRMAIVVLAVCALAQPVFVSPARLASWNSRFARVVIVDRSGTVGGNQASADEIAAAELRSAAFARRLDADDLAEAIPRAIATLDTLPPARREIVVVSLLRRGSLGASDIATVPVSIGLRFTQLDAAVERSTIPGMTLFGYGDIAARRHSIALGENTTGVTVEAGGTNTAGLRVIAPAGSERDIAALLRAVAIAGSPAPSPTQPIALFFGGETPQSVKPASDPWMIQALTRLANDVELRRTANELPQVAQPAATIHGASVLLRDRERRPILSAAAANSAAGRDELVLQSPVPAGSFIAAAFVRAALVARHGSVAFPEHEIAHTPASQLQGWTRPPQPVTLEEARRASLSDGRWVWALALLLIAVEALVRRVRPVRSADVEANAA